MRTSLRDMLVRIAVPVVLIGVLIGWVVLNAAPPRPKRLPRITFTIMGTVANMQVVADQDRAAKAFASARQALEKLDRLASTYKEDSQVSRLNRSPAGQGVELSPQLVEILAEAGRIREASDGAFDITVRPVLQLWKSAAKSSTMPSQERLDRARSLTGPGAIQIDSGRAVKRYSGVQIDLGGIAKGTAIDWAVDALRSHDIPGGFVDVGGDTRFWGRRRDGGLWRVGLRNPFDPKGEDQLAILEITDAAVCTSGNYFRYFQVGDQRLSHIVDPRTARPVDFAPSVTVIAPTASQADGWATALSVLGPKGLSRIEQLEGVEALVIAGRADNWTPHATQGFADYLRPGQLKQRIEGASGR